MIGNQIFVTLVEETCYKCSTHFAMDPNLQQQARNFGATFYCPNGHGQVYKESEVQRLKRVLKYAENSSESRRLQLDGERRRHAATKGKLTKTKNRIANGVCPCCNRTFQNVGRHMAGQHPDYAKP